MKNGSVIILRIISFISGNATKTIDFISTSLQYAVSKMS